MVLLPIAIFWVLAIWGFFSRKPILIYMLFGTMPFGSLAVIPTAITGGLTLTGPPIAALLIILRTFSHEAAIRETIDNAVSPRRLGLLTIFWASAIFATLFMPRLFAGSVEIVPLSFDGTIVSQPLFPTKQNISQLAYISISIISVFAFASIFKSAHLREHALRALLLAGVISIFTGVLDYSSQFLPIKPLLEPFRTASYALLTEHAVLNLKRTVGLMPEASSFGALCIKFLCPIYFFRHAISSDIASSRQIMLICGSLAVFAVLSTSSATYVALALFLMVCAMEWSWRASLRTESVIAPHMQAKAGRNRALKRGLAFEFWLAFSALLAVTALILFIPAVLDPIVNLVDQMVFQKTSSSSFEERSLWTAISLNAFFETYGFGVGLGGTRASNSFVAVLSNVGLLGATCYYAFVLKTLLQRVKNNDHQAKIVQNGIRFAFWPIFIPTLLTGTTPDFGLLMAFLFGLSVALTQSKSHKAASQSPSQSSLALPIPKKTKIKKQEGGVPHAR